MDGPQFDRFARRLAKGVSRRKVITTAAGSGAAMMISANASLAKSAQSPPKPLPSEGLEEYAVELYERLVAVVDQTVGSCEEMGKAATEFVQQHTDELDQIQAEMKGWSQEKREQHSNLYGERMDHATQRFHSAMARCGFHAGGNASGFCSASAEASAGLRLLPAQQDQCTCDNECPISPGDCVYYGMACAAGDHCSCCETSYCGSNSHCKSNCRDNHCCADACGNVWVPCPPPG